jgi:hypothetical protein
MALEDNQKVYQNFMTTLDKTKRPTLMASNSKLLLDVNRSLIVSNALTAQ